MDETIKFSRSLYAPEAVDSAVTAYAGLGVFNVEVDEHEVRVHIEVGESDIDDLADHFANHVLHQAIVGSRPGMSA